MTRNDIIDLPAGDPLHALAIALAIRLAEHIPMHPLLPDRRATDVLQGSEELRQYARSGIDARLGILFRGGEIEEQIGLDEGLVGLVIEDQFLVRVGVDEFDLEIVIEFLGDFLGGFGGGREDRAEGDVGYQWVGSDCCGSLFCEPLGPDYVCIGVGRCPG